MLQRGVEGHEEEDHHQERSLDEQLVDDEGRPVRADVLERAGPARRSLPWGTALTIVTDMAGNVALLRVSGVSGLAMAELGSSAQVGGGR